MEDTRVLVSTSWQQRLLNEKHKNWLKVGYALSKTCNGIRSYIERESKAFHATLRATLHGLPPCTCTHAPRRRPNPYHDMSICFWARELEKHHKGRPTWNQSDVTLWNDPNVGHWEVAKLFMPYGCAKGNSCQETDATGLLNLLYWCSHYKTDATLVERLKDTRNTWAHAATQELDATKTTNAFLSMKKFLQDAELVGDDDAIDTLTKITELENDALIDFKDLETHVLSELKQYIKSTTDNLAAKIDSMKNQENVHANEIKEEISFVQTILSYCVRIGEERDHVLFDVQSVLHNMQCQFDILLQKAPDSRNEEKQIGEKVLISLKYTSLWAIILSLKLLNAIPRNAILLIFLFSTIPILDESLDGSGCSTRESSKDVLNLQEIFEIFTLRLNRAREGFVGRQWLFKVLSHSLAREECKGVMIIGAPGFGKSALISNLICSKLSSYSLHTQILGYHLCIHSLKSTQNGAVFVRNLASMIAGRLQEYESLVERNNFIQKVLKYDKCSSDPTGCFEQGILIPLSRLQLQFLKPTMYIVVDALDECFNENERSTGTSILDILSNNIKHFPNWLKVILTSRNVTSIRDKFSFLDFFDFYPNDPRNLQDIEHFVSSQLRHSFLSGIRNIFVEEFSIPAMVNKSQGNFLYIKLVLEYLQTKDMSAASWKSLPTSINSIYQEFFERKFDTKEAFRGPRKIFEILVATLSPLTTEELYEVYVTNLKDPENFDFEYDFLVMLEDLSMYLSSTQERQIVTVYHNSLTEWLTSASNKGRRFYVDAKKGNQLLADYHFNKIQNNSISTTPRFVYNLAMYMVRGLSMKRHINNVKKIDPKLLMVTDDTNLTALHIAAGQENEDTFGLLLNIFKNIDVQDNSGRTPAFYAVAFDRLANLRLLHQKGASMVHMTSISTCGKPNAEDDFQYCERQMCGYNLLHVACQRGYINIVQFLLETNVSVSTPSELGYNALDFAAKHNHSEITKSLIKHGAIPDRRSLYYAALNGNPIVVRLLLEYGAEDTCLDCRKFLKGQFQWDNLDYLNYRERCNTALHISASKNVPSVAKVLLKSKRNAIHCMNYYGKNPLLAAVGNNNYKVTKLLLKSSADPSTSCIFNSLSDSFPDYCPCGHTPLHTAAHNGFSSIAKLLLKYKANYDARDCEGLQPIHVASCRGHADVLSILVKKGANINSKDPNNMTPMHYACKCQKDAMFDKLFELGANGTALTSNGYTPLHYIIQMNSIDEDFCLLDPYVSSPIEPIDVTYKSSIEQLFKAKYPWIISMTKFLRSFTKGERNSIFDLKLNTLFFDIIANVSKSMLGSLQLPNWEYVALTSPLHYPFDIGISSQLQNLTDKVESMSEVGKLYFKAKLRFQTDCSFLNSNIKINLIYTLDFFLNIGYDVNCNSSETSIPLLAYLRQGGRNVAKVLVKHRVIADIQCGKSFEDSVFHLAAYHKFHYLQYISVFRDPVKWEEYLKDENALFDYLFDKYERKAVDGQVKVIRVRDGPITNAIKSHPRGYKIIDECLDKEGYTALHRAAQGGNIVAVKHFLNWGADVTIRNQYGFNPLVLSIWYAVKYRPYFNFHKPSLSTSLEIEFASLTATVILSYLTREKPLHVGCDSTKTTPTLLHLAATRGMWKFIDKLFIGKKNKKVTGLTSNCPTRDNITPMYLAKLHGGDNCEWDNPWCKVVGTLLKYGASMIYPDPLTEYALMFNFLFHKVPDRLDLDLNEEERELLIIEHDEDIKDCSDTCDFIRKVFHGTKYDIDSEKWKSFIRNCHNSDRVLCSALATTPLTVAEYKFTATKLKFHKFLTKELKGVKSSFSYLKDVDDTTVRCATPMPHERLMEIEDNSEISKILERLQDKLKFEDAEQTGNGFFEDCSDLNIQIPPTFLNPENLDMCSSKVISTIVVTERYLKVNRQIFIKKYKSLIKNIEPARQALRRCKSQNLITDIHKAKHYSPRLDFRDLDVFITMFFRYYEKPLNCRLIETTYKYTQLKFLLHTIKFWNDQVQKLSFYPGISKFLSERLEHILLGEHKKEMTQMMLKLSDEDHLTNYKYLEMLRFPEPPMFNRTIKYT